MVVVMFLDFIRDLSRSVRGPPAAKEHRSSGVEVFSVE